jgi:hypothetical protein
LKSVVYRMGQILLATQIALVSAPRHGRARTESVPVRRRWCGTAWHGPAQVVRGDMLQPQAAAIPIHDVPDKDLTNAFAPYRSILADGAEHSSAADLGPEI